MANYYVGSVQYTAVTQFAISTAYTLGQIRRQLAAPSVGSERCFRCTTAGTSGGSESAWNLTKNATTTQGTAVFTECTGQETYNTTAWTAPFARLAEAISSSFSAAGDTIFVAHNHAETRTTALNMTSAGTFASPQRILCTTVPSSAIPPTSADLTTGGTVTVSNTNDISLDGSLYCYGLFFVSGAASGGPFIYINSTTKHRQIYDHCTFRFSGTSGNSRMSIGNQSSGVISGVTEWWNCTLHNAGPMTTLAILLKSSVFRWLGGSLTGSGGVATLMLNYASAIPVWGAELVGVDLSVMTTSQNILAQPGSNEAGGIAYSISNCKLPASYPAGTVMSGTIQAPNWGNVDMITTHNTGQGAREEHYRYQGSIVADLSNYRNGGATDGVSSKSWKMVSLTTASYHNFLEAPELFTWLPSAATYTLTMFVANTSALTLTDQELGFDYLWMGTSGVPLATLSTTLSNPLATGSALTTDSTSTWTGLASPVKQKISVTIAVTEPGYVRIRPRLCRASATVYIDPLIVVS